MNEDISVSNSRKLDELLKLLRGEPGAPGLLSRMTRVETILDGDGKEIGLTQRVNIIWRVHWWILCTVSAGAGALLTEAIHLLIKRTP